MKKIFKKSISIVIALMMVLGVIPFAASAANDYTINSTVSTDNYYNLISKKDWDIAPGITESEIVLNSDDGSRRQVLFVMEADTNNEYVKVINSYNGMIPQHGSYKVGVMSQQAAYAEANGYGNVVGAMNTCLSWYNTPPYTTTSPDRIGEPLGFIMLDAEVLFDPSNCGYEYGKVGFPSVLVINKDFDEEGNPRPADIPKVEMPQITSAADLDGWEDQVIPASSGYIVKDGVNQATPNRADSASRSVIGIKPDGTVVIMLNDGRQAPYSTGMCMYELAEVMLDLGCTYAVNCDGGGSSTYLSQRPGEELTVNNSPSDGTERPTTTGILFITTAPADGAFARANITSEATYYTPGSTVKFTALGTDLVGTEAEIPADATWQLADPSFGTIADGVFVSNGKLGEVTAQMVYEGKVVGEHTIEIVIPTEFTFSQAVMTVPFEKTVTIGINATINNGLNSVVLKPEDVVLTTTNSALGVFDGFKFTSVSEENAPADLTSTLTATLVHDTSLVATAALNLGKGSEVLFDFEDSADIDEWNIAEVNGNDKGFYQHVSFATSADGQVHDGVGSMRVEMNPISANEIPSGGYGQSDLFLDEGVIVENAKSVGFWAYLPDEYEHCWIRVLYWVDTNNDGKFETKNTITVINQPEVYNKWDESGWKYFSVDVSNYSKVLIPGRDCKDILGYNASKNEANNFRFIEFMFPHTNTNDLWKTYGTINGLQTVYIDNITVDYSDAVDDREAPIFSKVELAGLDSSVALEKYTTAKTADNLVTVSATVAEDTQKTNATGLDAASAKAYVDGVPVDVTFAKGRMTISNLALADGVHRIKFEICDNMGNKAVAIRLIEVDSGVDASTVQLVPANPELNNLYGGSVYWMNLNANKIETIKSVKAVIDLNYGNHFELDNMVLEDGFAATYTIDQENNTATIVINRSGVNTKQGAATIAAIPLRVIYYDTDIKIEGYTAETYWKEYAFWPYDLKVDVDMGEITYVDGYTSEVLGAFSNEEFSVDTEFQAGFSNSAFKAERGTAHVHTETAVEDKAATCTKGGLVGKTYCEVCDSIVNWGTKTPAAGHSFDASVDGLHTCEDCGETYYYVDSDALTGWQTIGDKVYYLDQNGVAANGKYTVDGHEYTFENFVLIDAAFENDGYGITAWWAGEQVKGGITYESKWKEFNGKKYYFTDIYAATGLVQVKIGTDTGYKYYIFEEDTGVWMEYYTGLYEGTYKGKTGLYYAENGICVHKGLVLVDGYYYYINDSFKAVKAQKYYVSRNNGLLPQGEYEFDAQGRLIAKNGIVEEGGKLYYYETGLKVAKGLVYDEASGNYYCFGVNFYAIGEGQYWLNEAKLNGLTGPDGKELEPGYYTVNADCSVQVTKVKNGIYNEEGKLYYYENGAKVAKGLVFDETTGNYYCFGKDFFALEEGEYWLNELKLNGLAGPDGKVLKPGFYTVNADRTIRFEEPKNGIYEENGKLYYYENNVKVAKGLVYDEATGNYYCFGIKFYAIGEGQYWFNELKLNGLTGPDGKVLEPGLYNVNADCVVIIK